MAARTAIAPAKLNFSLEVRPADRSGLHPVRGLTQSIGWHDILTMEESDTDRLSVHGADLPSGEGNLVWKAVKALRRRSGDLRRVEMKLWKRIPVAAGLAGGSADAAAALTLYGDLIGARDRPDRRRSGADRRGCHFLSSRGSSLDGWVR